MAHGNIVFNQWVFIFQCSQLNDKLAINHIFIHIENGKRHDASECYTELGIAWVPLEVILLCYDILFLMSPIKLRLLSFLHLFLSIIFPTRFFGPSLESFHSSPPFLFPFDYKCFSLYWKTFSWGSGSYISIIPSVVNFVQ